MCDHHHRHAFLRKLLHEGQHLADHFRVESGSRFIEQDYIGIHRKGAHDCNPLLLPAGKLLGIGIAFFVKPDPFQQCVGFCNGLRFSETPCFYGCQRNVLKNGQVRKQIEVLEDHADLLPEPVDVGMRPVDLFFLEPDFAGGRFFEQIQAAQERALAGTGGSDDENHFSVVNFRGYIMYRMKRVESFYKVPDPEYRLGKIGFTHCFSTSVPVCPAES